MITHGVRQNNDRLFKGGRRLNHPDTVVKNAEYFMAKINDILDIAENRLQENWMRDLLGYLEEKLCCLQDLYGVYPSERLNREEDL